MPTRFSRTSRIWRSMVISGFSDVMGSWKIIAISRPRTDRATAGSRMSRPRQRIEPRMIRPGVCTSPRTASAVTLLPEPDSPTTARRSFAATFIVTFSTP